MTTPSLLGTWSALSWEIRSTDGTVALPLGDNPRGLITYDAAGRMAVQLMRPDRALCGSADPFQAAPDEIVASWMGFISYAGRYEHDPVDRRVVHRVEICSFPNWVGTSQERLYVFDGDLLVLSTPPISLGGESSVSTLVWKPVR